MHWYWYPFSHIYTVYVLTYHIYIFKYDVDYVYYRLYIYNSKQVQFLHTYLHKHMIDNEISGPCEVAPRGSISPAASWWLQLKAWSAACLALPHWEKRWKGCMMVDTIIYGCIIDRFLFSNPWHWNELKPFCGQVKGQMGWNTFTDETIYINFFSNSF